MKYRLYKSRYDRRIMTHGIILPDGFFRIFEMTRHNGRHIESMIARGYTVEEEETDTAPCGIYDEETGERVTDASVLAALDGGGRAALVFLTPEQAYNDPMATVGLPKSAFKRGYQPPLRGPAAAKPLAAADVQEQSRTLKLKGSRAA